MARIRSIHPGQWKDEDFVELSPCARLLALGLRNISDDQGVFEWKPKTIKMELFPGDTFDVLALLQELVDHRQVQQYVHDEKPYGAIRNFRKWQSPKYPSNLYPLPEPLAVYVGISPNGTPSTQAIPPKRRNDQRSSPAIPACSGNETVEIKGEERRGEEKSTTATAVVSPPTGGDAPAADPAPAVPLDAAAALWNELCGQALGRVSKLTDIRRKHLRARLVEHWPHDPLGGWRAYCQRIMRSDFLTGRRASTGSHAGWKADFDWSVNSANAVKVVEGRYDNDRDRAPPPPDDGRWVPAPGTV